MTLKVLVPSASSSNQADWETTPSTQITSYRKWRLSQPLQPSSRETPFISMTSKGVDLRETSGQLSILETPSKLTILKEQGPFLNKESGRGQVSTTPTTTET